ncbi:MAG: hypothetical protein LAP39_07880 [Acidobacteriia bacterium]|nr:hypothetical protein [Terriglobia bacterium]
MSPDGSIYCISLRLRRITIEDAYVNVPLTEAITKPTEEGNRALDPDAFMREGIRLSDDPRVEWQVESATTECHPVQQARPEDRTALDVHD